MSKKSRFDWSISGLKDTVKGAKMSLMDTMKGLVESKPTGEPEGVEDDKKRKKKSDLLVYKRMGEAKDVEDEIDEK